MLARIAKLELELQIREKGKSDSAVSNASPSSRSDPEPLLAAPAGQQNRFSLLPNGQEYDSNQEEHVFQGGTSLLQSIAVLDHTVGSDEEAANMPSPLESEPRTQCSFMECIAFPECCKGDLQTLNARTRPHHAESMRAAFKVFFSYPHPHCKSNDSFVTISWADNI